MTPTVVGQLVYVASCSGSLFAFDKSSGEVRWRYDTAADGAPAQFHGDPVVVDDLLVIPSDARPAGLVYAFDLETGEVRWKTPVAPGGITSHLARAGSSVVGLTPTGRLSAFELATGTERWAVEVEVEPGQLGLNAHPAVAGDRVFYGAPDGRVRAVEVDSGEVVWATDLGSRINTAAIIDGEHLLVGAVDGSLYRLARAGGEVTTRLDLATTPVGTPVLVGETLVLVGAGGLLAVVDRELTRTVWTYPSGPEWSSFQPLVEGGRVVAGTDDGEIYAFALEDGRIVWQDELAGTPRGIGRSAGVYYVGTLQGNLFAWTPDATTVASASDPLSWLAGNWRGRMGETFIEETWSEREGDNRMGMFRMVAEGTVRFYEFMSIEYEKGGEPVLRIKHFGKGLRGWEEKDESEVLQLVESGTRQAVFGQPDAEEPMRLTYTLEESGELVVVLEKEQAEEEPLVLRFRRDRQPPS